MDTQVYFRKAFSVEAVQVTNENIDEIVEWTSGHLQQDPNGVFVRVQVQRPMTNRQTKAYVGDWLLKSNRGFKVYTDAAFRNGFLKDEDGAISQGWANVFDNETAHVGTVVSEKDAISGKR